MASKYRPSGRSDYRMQRLSEGLEGAQSGAALGSALGPGGALVGGLIGGAAGALRGGPSEAQRARDAELRELERRKRMGDLGLTGEERAAMERQIKDPLRMQQREFAARMGGLDMGAGAAAAQAIALQEQQARQQMDADAEIAKADMMAAQQEETLMRELQDEKQQELEQTKKDAIAATAKLATTAKSSAEDLADIRMAEETQSWLGFNVKDKKAVAKGTALFEQALGGTALGKARKAMLEQVRADEERAKDTAVEIDDSQWSSLAADDTQRAARLRGLYGRDRMTLRNPPAVSGPAFADPVAQATRQAMIDADNRAAIQEEAAYLAGREMPVAPPLPGIMGFDMPMGAPLPQMPTRANAADLSLLGIDPYARSFNPGQGAAGTLPIIDKGASRFLMDPARNPLLDPFAIPAPGAPLHNIPPELLAADPGGMTVDMIGMAAEPQLWGGQPMGLPPNYADLQALGLVPPGSMFPSLGAGTAYLDTPLYSSYGPSPMTEGLETPPVAPMRRPRRWRRR